MRVSKAKGKRQNDRWERGKADCEVQNERADAGR
jgi:hypothetical protein